MQAQEAFEWKTLALSVKHGESEQKIAEALYKLPDFKVWAYKTPYLYIHLDNLNFTTEGEYTFEISVDGQIKGEETIYAYHGG